MALYDWLSTKADGNSTVNDGVPTRGLSVVIETCCTSIIGFRTE
jgi:hypothetical protein